MATSRKVFCKILSILAMYKIEDSYITGQGGSKMYNVEEKCMELINKEKDCGMNSSQFYEETVEFVEDVEDYYAISKQELEFIIEQVCEGYIDLNAFYIAMIPFEPDIDGILVGSEKNRIHIKCNHIREKRYWKSI